jgi:hypothetical protein
MDLADLRVVAMNAPQDNQPEPPAVDAVPTPAEPEPAPAPARATRPREIGGRNGPDPTRYGDWEKAGRCIDF